jgi:hypothetical protein
MEVLDVLPLFFGEERRLRGFRLRVFRLRVFELLMRNPTLGLKELTKTQWEGRVEGGLRLRLESSIW